MTLRHTIARTLGLGLLLTLCRLPAVSADAVLDLQTAKLEIADTGQVQRLIGPDGANLAPASAPACFEIDTAGHTCQPVAVARSGNELLVRFAGGAGAKIGVEEHKGFALLTLEEISGAAQVTRFRLAGLAVDGDRVGTLVNSCSNERDTVSVMTAEPNVREYLTPAGGKGSDLDRCSHEFLRESDTVKTGQYAARFIATSRRTTDDGWSVVSESWAYPKDLTGLTAIRAWIHGDAKGELLKIQLYDGKGGYRDDYVQIDFHGWRQVVLKKPAVHTADLSHITQLSFYYNGLPAGQRVECLIDQVEAVVGSEPVVLESFDNSDDEFWGQGGTRLYAESYSTHGIQPARAGILVCPTKEFAATIERFEKAAKLPSPHPGGVWSKLSPWTRRSYLFITRFSAADTDDVIDFAKRGDFQTILIGQESWCAATGHYTINEKNFPGGLPTLQATIAKLHQAGFRVGLHFLGPSIWAGDAYLTPIPDPRLVKDETADLAADVDEKADFIPTAAAPTRFPTVDGGYEGRGTYLQVDNEIIQYSGISTTAPFGFKKCHRGMFGTAAARHSAGAKVAHLLRSYGYFLFDMDTSLLDEVASNFAKVANACKIDMVYFDGSERLQGDHWYYNARLHKAFYDKFANKDMLVQASSTSPYSWHIVSRTASADGRPDLKDYLDQRSDHFAGLADNLLPLDLGWYYLYTPNTTTDQWEYVLTRSIGYSCSISLQTSPETIRNHPYIDEIVDLVGKYEKLRLSGKVDDEMRTRLREKRREYRLLEDHGHQVFQRVVYDRWHDVTALDGQQNHWDLNVPDGPAKVGIQFLVPRGQWISPGPSYNNPKAQLLESFDDLRPYTGDTQNNFDIFVIGPGKAGSVHRGVTQTFTSTQEGAPPGQRCAVYTATSTLDSDDGWSSIGRRFDPPLNLSWSMGIGFSLRGDGHGGKFKLQLRDDKGAALDYYISNDYTGWRYHQLPRPETDPIDFGHVRYLIFYYNNLPAHTTVSCGIDDVKALPALDSAQIVNPSVTIGDHTFTWKTTLPENSALTYWPEESCTLFDSATRTRTPLAMPSGKFALPAGTYPVTFKCAAPQQTAVRVRVTLQPQERYTIGK